MLKNALKMKKRRIMQNKSFSFEAPLYMKQIMYWKALSKINKKKRCTLH